MKIKYHGPGKSFGLPQDAEATQVLRWTKRGPAHEVPDEVAADLLTRTGHHFHGPTREEERALIERVYSKSVAAIAETPEDTPEPILPINSPAVLAPLKEF